MKGSVDAFSHDWIHTVVSDAIVFPCPSFGPIYFRVTAFNQMCCIVPFDLDGAFGAVTKPHELDFLGGGEAKSDTTGFPARYGCLRAVSLLVNQQHLAIVFEINERGGWVHGVANAACLMNARTGPVILLERGQCPLVLARRLEVFQPL